MSNKRIIGTIIVLFIIAMILFAPIIIEGWRVEKERWVYIESDEWIVYTTYSGDTGIIDEPGWHSIDRLTTIYYYPRYMEFNYNDLPEE